MKIGIFGGTFDPIHLGHIAILKAAAKSGYIDKIIVIPNAYPPHKPLDQTSMASYRYEMTRIALKEFNFEIPVVLSDMELFRKGKSYTLDTILELKTTYSISDQFVLIYGSDVVFEIENWHQPRQIMKECELFIARRPGFEGDEFDNKVKFLVEHFCAKIAFFQADYIDISSTELRESLVSEPDKKQVFILPAVHEWITKNKIYENQKNLSQISYEVFLQLREYECELRKIITKDRLIHSINTMREAVKLAVLFGGDIDKCAIAGLLHDCAKSKTVDIEKQFHTTGKDNNKFSGHDDVLHNVTGDIDSLDAIKESKVDGLSEKTNISNDISNETAQIERNDPNLSDPLLSPDILHAYLGKKMAIDKFNIEDKDILNAIYYHTTSRNNSSLLEKIIFVADKIEPGRTFPRIDEIRLMTYRDLEEGLLNCLADIIKLLYHSNKVPHPDTIASYESILNKKK